jgi:hypothetical protein
MARDGGPEMAAHAKELVDRFGYQCVRLVYDGARDAQESQLGPTLLYRPNTPSLIHRTICVWSFCRRILVFCMQAPTAWCP